MLNAFYSDYLTNQQQNSKKYRFKRYIFSDGYQKVFYGL
jgi:hypothetical protein